LVGAAARGGQHADLLFGDNGRPHVWDKQWLSDAGLRVPLIVRWRGRVPAGKTEARLVSLIDVSAETLHSAGLPLPAGMDGRAFSRPRHDPHGSMRSGRGSVWRGLDRIRSVHSERSNYIRNYYPELPYWQTSRYKSLQYRCWPCSSGLPRGRRAHRCTGSPSGRHPSPRKNSTISRPTRMSCTNLARDPAYASDLDYGCGVNWTHGSRRRTSGPRRSNRRKNTDWLWKPATARRIHPGEWDKRRAADWSRTPRTRFPSRHEAGNQPLIR